MFDDECCCPSPSWNSRPALINVLVCLLPCVSLPCFFEIFRTKHIDPETRAFPTASCACTTLPVSDYWQTAIGGYRLTGGSPARRGWGYSGRGKYYQGSLGFCAIWF